MEDRIAPSPPTGVRDRRLVTARVPHAAAPTSPPEDLAPYVTAVRRDGVRTPLDWDLNPSRFAASAPVEEMGRIARRFGSWRATWMARFALAEVPEIERFARFSAAEGFTLLARLVDGAAVYDPDELDDLDGELAAVPATLEVSRGHGWRFVDTSSHKVMRVASAPGRLHGNNDDDWEIVIVDGRGVRLRVLDEVHDVVGWALTRSGVTVTVTGTSSAEVQLSGPPARGLAQLAPSAPRVSVERVPLARLWQPLVDQLTDAVTAAVIADAVVLVTPEH